MPILSLCLSHRVRTKDPLGPLGWPPSRSGQAQSLGRQKELASGVRSSSDSPVTCTQTETILVPHHTLLRDGWEGQPNCVGQNLTWYWTIWQYMKVLGAQGLLLGLLTSVLEALVQLRWL